MTAIPDPIGRPSNEIRISVLDEHGVDRLYAEREPAWLIALAAQIDQDHAESERRFARAYARLWEAVTALTDAAA